MSRLIGIIERGWPGHYCLAHQCIFRRNTLIISKKVKIVVSTVGNRLSWKNDGTFEEVGINRYFETMVFHALDHDKYDDADITKEIGFSSPWMLNKPGEELRANQMHNNVIKEIVQRIEQGEFDE